MSSYYQQCRELSTSDLIRHASVCERNDCKCTRTTNYSSSFTCVARRALARRMRIRMLTRGDISQPLTQLDPITRRPQIRRIER